MGFLTRMASRFVAGETKQEAWPKIKELNDAGICTSCDILGENVTNSEGATRMTEEYLDLLDFLVRENVSQRGKNVSLKLTMFGLDESPDLCLQNMRNILKKAKEHGFFVRIDMEGSKYTDSILHVFFTLRKEFDNVGVVLQAYLKRTYDDIKKVLAVKGQLRLCKGAYKESPDIAYQTKAEIRANYLKCASLLIADSGYHGFATHDGYLQSELLKMLANDKRDKSSYEFQMLYGMRRSTWYEMVAQGYNFRVYVPFGSDWLPYFGRRLRERKENVFFLVSNLFSQ